MEQRELTQNELMEIHLEQEWASTVYGIHPQPYHRKHSVVLGGETTPTSLSWLVISATSGKGRFSEQHIRFLGDEPDDLRFGLAEPSPVSIYNFQFKRQKDGFGVLSKPSNGFGLELTHHTPPEGTVALCSLNGLVVVESDRLELGENVAITALRRQLDERRTVTTKPANKSKKQNKAYVSKRSAFGIIDNVVPNEQYL